MPASASGRSLSLGLHSRKQPLAIRDDVATDHFLTKCRMRTIGQILTYEFAPESGHSCLLGASAAL